MNKLRSHFTVFAFAALLIFTGEQATGQEVEWKHASSLTGTPKYPPDFKHFDYVNPEAPKGGVVRLADTGGFDTFNHLPPKGKTAAGLGLIYETLMTSSMDEYDVSTSYGLVADAIRYPEDFSWVEFKLNPDVRWHDGKPITVDDVIWSFNRTIEISPSRKSYYKNVVMGEITSDSTVKFTFDVKDNRELPHIMGQLLILPKHWWEGVDSKGNSRDLESATLEPPLGSGPYRIKDFEANRSVTYERVEDYWGAEHPTQVGHNNFNQIKYIEFFDRTVRFEGFKGDVYDFHEDNTSSNWCNNYEFEAVKDGRVIRKEFPDKSTGIMQAYVFNLRLDKFSDQRFRRALNYAFDFETTNKIVSCSLFERINSYFAGTELAASGLPEGMELEILETVRGQVPDEVFTTEYKNPVNGSPENLRENLRKAVKLLNEAGYNLEDGKLIDPKSGEQVTLEFIYRDKTSERWLLPFTQNLEKIGIKSELKIIDSTQYVNRILERDFEMTTLVWGQTLSPGNEQRDSWGSEAADLPHSGNHAGIKNPAIDTLIDRVIFAKDRDELIAATKALDRVLLWNFYVIPQFYKDVEWYARWDRFSGPEKLPEFSFGFPSIWWWDEEKAAKTGAN